MILEIRDYTTGKVFYEILDYQGPAPAHGDAIHVTGISRPKRRVIGIEWNLDASWHLCNGDAPGRVCERGYIGCSRHHGGALRLIVHTRPIGHRNARSTPHA